MTSTDIEITLYESFQSDNRAWELERALKYGLAKGEDEFWKITKLCGGLMKIKIGLCKANKSYHHISDVQVIPSENNFNIKFTFKE